MRTNCGAPGLHSGPQQRAEHSGGADGRAAGEAKRKARLVFGPDHGAEPASGGSGPQQHSLHFPFPQQCGDGLLLPFRKR